MSRVEIPPVDTLGGLLSTGRDSLTDAEKNRHVPTKSGYGSWRGNPGGSTPGNSMLDTFPLLIWVMIVQRLPLRGKAAMRGVCREMRVFVNNCVTNLQIHGCTVRESDSGQCNSAPVTHLRQLQRRGFNNVKHLELVGFDSLAAPGGSRAIVGVDFGKLETLHVYFTPKVSSQCMVCDSATVMLLTGCRNLKSLRLVPGNTMSVNHDAHHVSGPKTKPAEASDACNNAACFFLSVLSSSCPNLASLSLGPAPLRVEDAAKLVRLPSLKEVREYEEDGAETPTMWLSNAVNPNSCSCLAQLGGLEHLALGLEGPMRDWSEEPLFSLAALQGLQELHLSNGFLGPSATWLHKLGHLRRLALTCAHIELSALGRLLTSLPVLEELALGPRTFDGVLDHSTLKGCTNLKALEIVVEDTWNGQDLLAALLGAANGTLPSATALNVQHLSLSWNWLQHNNTKQAVVNLPGSVVALKGLQVLDIDARRCFIAPESLSALNELQKLREVRLDTAELNPELFTAVATKLPNLPALRKLHLGTVYLIDHMPLRNMVEKLAVLPTSVALSLSLSFQGKEIHDLTALDILGPTLRALQLVPNRRNGCALHQVAAMVHQLPELGEVAVFTPSKWAATECLRVAPLLRGLGVRVAVEQVGEMP